jgi:ABC-type sugar transport system permease subunit
VPTDQPVFVARYVEERSRVSTFFRLILAIPHVIVVALWAVAAALVTIAAGFILLFTARGPQGLYSFVSGYQRYSTAVYGYVALLTDEYPPFSGETDGYPVQILIPPAKPEYNRMKVLFRIILAIPIAIVVYAMQIVWEVGAFLAWFAIVFLGKQPKGLQDMTALGLGYQQRANLYFGLLTEDWPPFSNPEPALEPGPSPSSLPPSAPETPVSSSGSSFAPPEPPAGGQG